MVYWKGVFPVWVVLLNGLVVKTFQLVKVSSDMCGLASCVPVNRLAHGVSPKPGVPLFRKNKRFGDLAGFEVFHGSCRFVNIPSTRHVVPVRELKKA